MNLHPIVIHFPAALLVTAFLAELTGFFLKKKDLSRFAWWNQILGTLGLAAAIYTGLQAEKSARFSPAAHDLFEYHEQIAFIVGGVFALLLLWRIGTKGQLPVSLWWLYLLLYTAGIAALASVAWFGGELVFRYGTGVHL